MTEGESIETRTGGKTFQGTNHGLGDQGPCIECKLGQGKHERGHQMAICRPTVPLREDTQPKSTTHTHTHTLSLSLSCTKKSNPAPVSSLHAPKTVSEKKPARLSSQLFCCCSTPYESNMNFNPPYKMIVHRTSGVAAGEPDQQHNSECAVRPTPQGETSSGAGQQQMDESARCPTT